MSRERDRKIPIQVYLSENEKYVLDEKIKESNMRNISEYIRHLILYGYVYDIDYNGLKEYNYQIAALGRNINMIRERIMKTGNAYEEDLNEIKELMDKIWHDQQECPIDMFPYPVVPNFHLPHLYLKRTRLEWSLQTDF